MGTLSFLNSKFYFAASSSVETNAALKAGLKFDGETLRWVTRNFNKAQLLRRFADGSAERKLKRYFITDLAPPEFILYPDHLAPRSWQMESAWHALTRTPAYIADEAGLGKTITAILCMNSSPGNTLITCPPYLKYNWGDELKRWLCWQSTQQDQYAYYASTPRMSVVSVEDDLNVIEDNIIVLPDSLLTHKEIQKNLRYMAPFKWIIADEFHRFKTEDAQRTQAFVGGDKDGFNLADLGERLVFLSGTPTPNGKPIELYAPLSKLAPQAIGYRSLEEFGKTFCAGKRVTRYEGKKALVNWDFSGASNLKQLQGELQSKLMVRHLKCNHLKELGPKTRRLIFLDAPKDIQLIEKNLLRDITIEEIIGSAHVLSAPYGKTLGRIASYRREVGVSKIKQALQYITDILESAPDKLVVSAHHIEVVEELHKLLDKYNPLEIRGGIPAHVKAERVKLFQTNPKYRVIVGNTLSMGLGNTLTRASRLVVVEPDWTPGVNEQMEDRIHRISQDKHVNIDYLVLRNSLDERMLRRALEKEDNIHTLMN